MPFIQNSVMENVFVVNTPFQLYVVRHIIHQYFVSDNNLILSTIKKTNANDIVGVSPNIKGYLKAWKLIYHVKRNIKDISFFIPHLGNLFSSYFFELSVKYGRPVSVYYEGLALFYDPVVPNRNAVPFRKLGAFLLGAKYNHHEKLYSQELIEKAVACYSPTNNALLKKYHDVKIITFGRVKKNKANNNILFLTSDTATLKEIAACKRDVESVVFGIGQLLYIKPHYALPPEMLRKFEKSLSEISGLSISILDKSIPMEELYDTISFNNVISQRFSSAVINLKFIYGDDVKCKITNTSSIPMDIVKELGVELS